MTDTRIPDTGEHCKRCLLARNVPLLLLGIQIMLHERLATVHNTLRQNTCKSFLYFADRTSLHDLVNKANLVHNFS